MYNNANQSTKKYIVRNEQGEEFLLPKYAAIFRILMDDKDTIRDVLNSLLQLDPDHGIVDLEYEFEKPIDIFMPENDRFCSAKAFPTACRQGPQLKKIRFLSFNVQNPYKITIILLIFAKKCLTSGNAGRGGGRLTLYVSELPRGCGKCRVVHTQHVTPTLSFPTRSGISTSVILNEVKDPGRPSNVRPLPQAPL